MNGAPNRAADGGWLIDRDRQETFTFDSREIPFHPGDTVASALLAADVKLVGRSFKLHRPRGIYGLGAEEPNALGIVGAGDRSTPNVRLTTQAAAAGLKVASQNRWPSLRHDAFGMLDRAKALLPAGFYYKTFMWPASQWMRYERYIRRMAGLGPPPTERDPDRYARRSAHAGVLIAGGGPAGLSAALAAAAAGEDVLLAHSGPAFGGGLNDVGDPEARAWLAATMDALEAAPNVRLMLNTTVAGYYDGQMLTLAERVESDDPAAPRERFWHLYAGRTVIATGAIERPMLFADNDRPGVMLAGAARGYLWRYGVLAGQAPILFGADDAIYAIADEMQAAGAHVRAVVDPRPEPAAADALRAKGVRVETGAIVARAHGGKRVEAAEVWRLGSGEPVMIESVACDAVLTSGGWGPALQLHAQARGKLEWNDGLRAFTPGEAAGDWRSVGGARGVMDLEAAKADGAAAGRGEAAAPLSTPAPDGPAPWELPKLTNGLRFVDFQNDVADKDIELAAREGYRSIEHVKRYTTLGMGTDQGKAAGPVGLALLAAATGQEIAATGVTTFRPPTTPVTFGAVAGGHFGEVGHAVRRTAADEWHASQNAKFVDAGLWRRPQFYPANGTTVSEAYPAEAIAVRRGVGVVDVSTLGKIDVAGPDAAELLDRLYINTFSTLKPGRGRYGVMLREDGRVFDDGVVFRLSPDRYHVTCTTGGASAVYQHIEYALQVLWPELEAYATPVTEEWFAAAIAGPRARDLLAAVLPDLDVSNTALPMMALAEAQVFGQRVRVMRMSYSGELSFELNIGADWGLALWERILAAGKGLGVTVYGTEAMGALRIEKGHVTHAEADGRTMPVDLGLGRMVSKKKDAIGARALRLGDLERSGRKQLVGLIAKDPTAKFPVGCQVTAEDTGDTPRPAIGHVTSYARSEELGRHVALALVKNGRAMHGQTAFAVSPVMGQSIEVEIADPVMIDPAGERLRG